MKKVVAYSVEFIKLEPVGNAFYAYLLEGGRVSLPKSCVLGRDFSRANFWWVAGWMMDKKGISHLKERFAEFTIRNPIKYEKPEITYERTSPPIIKPIAVEIPNELKKC